MGSGHKIFAARAQLETQGTSMVAHGGGGAVCAGTLHRDNDAPLTSLVLCCQILSGEILKAHTVEENMAGLNEVVCRDLQAIIYQLVLRIYAQLMGDIGRVVVEVLNGSTEVD